MYLTGIPEVSVLLLRIHPYPALKYQTDNIRISDYKLQMVRLGIKCTF